jgi:hypothetical protein
MANRKRTRAYRGQSKRTNGSGALLDTVRSTITRFTGNSGERSSRGASRGGGLSSQATGFIGGLLSGGGASGRSRGRRRR